MVAKVKSTPLAMTENDLKMMLAAEVHLGSRNLDPNMAEYVYKRSATTGVQIINLKKTWEKLMLAARAIVTIENPEDICVISNSVYGQRAVYKFSQYTQTRYVASRWNPGTFTNQIQKMFMEPRLLVVSDPRTDHQPISEAAYVNIPVIAFCDTDSPLQNVDIAIPANNKSKNSVAVLYWLLAREVLRLRGVLARKQEWDVMPDLFIYREPEEAEKEAEKVSIGEELPEPAAAGEWAAEPVEPIPEDIAAGWGANVPEAQDWSAEPTTAGWS